jgi:aspartate/methionine/tyrosine aminotransferase
VISIVAGVHVPVAFNFHDDGAITLDLDKLFAAVGARTKAIFINSPHNPTGWIMPAADMIQLRDFARERGLWIVADEVYNHFVYADDNAGPAPSFLQLCTPEDRLLVTNTFSKNWCMTGWRAGWLVFPEGLHETFANLCQYNTTGVATFIQHACVTALDGGDGFIAAQVERCRAARAILLAGLSVLDNVTVFEPRGTFYLFFRVNGLAGGSLAMVRRILREARVGMAPGRAFGGSGDAYLRLCFAIDPALARETLKRLVPFLQQLGPDTVAHL